MKKFIVAATAALVMTLSAGAVQAEDHDVAQIKCTEFLQSGSFMPSLLMWIDGYLSAATDNTVMDDAYIEELGTKLGSFCTANPDATLLDAINSLGE